MAIQVPQTQPNAPQVVNPFPIADSYLNRQQNQQQLFNNALGNVGDTYNQMRQQRIQNQLNALAAYTGIAKAVGPDAANQVAGNIPNMPNWGNVYQSPAQGMSPSAVPAGGVGGGSGNAGGQGTNYGGISQGSAQANPGQTAPSPSSQGSPQTLGGNGSPSPYIQASLAAGHPDFTGQFQKLQGQMSQYQNKGDWGREQSQQLASQIPAITGQMTAEKQPLEMAKMQSEVNRQPLETEKLQGEVGMQPIQKAKMQQEMGLAVTKPIAEEVSKQTQSNQQIGQIENFYSNLQDALSRNHGGIAGNISGKAYQLTGGRLGSGAAADVLNAANPLATALNTELSHRFNSGEVQLLSDSLVPKPGDTPDYAQQKMKALGQMINAMKSGNETSIQNVGQALMGRPIGSLTGKANVGPAPIPQGRVTVISPSGQVGHIPASQLKEAIAAGYKEQ